MSKLVFGCGYLGKRVATLWRGQGHQVHVVTRSRRHARQLRHEGLCPLVADVTRLETLAGLPSAETVLFAVGFDSKALMSLTEVYAGGVRNVLASMHAAADRFLYVSTTGVYGPADGTWVDEATPPNPIREGGKASLAAEQALGDNAVVLRLAGIYGPGRIPYLEKLRAGEPLATPKAGWLNLIHVDDAAEIVLAAEAWAAQQPPSAGPHTFCVSDGRPVVRRDYYREVARQIGAPAPTFVAPAPNSPATARASADKRIRTAKLTGLLQIQLRYPSYREGLAAILASA